MSLIFHSVLRKLYTTEPSIGASFQIAVYLATRFQRRRFFLEIKQIEMSNLYRGPSIDFSYHVSAYFAKRFQRFFFNRNRLIRNNNCLWQLCLLTNRDEMNNLYREPSYMVPTKFRFIWPCSFGGEDFS